MLISMRVKCTLMPKLLTIHIVTTRENLIVSKISMVNKE